MKEFGSDFHYIESTNNINTVFDFYPKANMYANGRQAIQALISNEGWKRIWMPDYFCYDIIDSLKKTNISICFYHDNPLSDDQEKIFNLEFEKGDVLFRMNYFGLRSFRNNEGLGIPVIEDHSHDLLGEWATQSNADWCIASMRKTLPIVEGGILWSPKNFLLPELPKQTDKNILLEEKRRKAMCLKKDYLTDKISDKKEFRKLFLDTESEFDELQIAPITDNCKTFLMNFDIRTWYRQKQRNWFFLSDMQSDKIKILKKEKEGCNNFSLILLFNAKTVRDEVRRSMIANCIYPAILWGIPENKPEVKNISDKMLSVACDGRYSDSDIVILKSKIENVLKNV